MKMIRHVRSIEDEQDEQLICDGWETIGISLWEHPKFEKTNFIKEDALCADISNYHVINLEHYKMLQFIIEVSKVDSNRATNLLEHFKYI